MNKTLSSFQFTAAEVGKCLWGTQNNTKEYTDSAFTLSDNTKIGLDSLSQDLLSGLKYLYSLWLKCVG